MQNTLTEKVRNAIKESQAARDVFTNTMYETSEKLGYTDPGDRGAGESQFFGKPANEDSIRKLESILNATLPPSYREFLLINDGWEVVDGSQSFFSIGQLLEWRKRKDPSGWIAIAKQYGSEFVERCLVVGASDNSPDKYLLNPNIIGESGEWQFIEFSKDGHEAYESFLDYLVSTKEQFYESAREVDLDDYYDPFEES